jgi:hypothetical protein
MNENILAVHRHTSERSIVACRRWQQTLQGGRGTLLTRRISLEKELACVRGKSESLGRKEHEAMTPLEAKKAY